MLKFSKLPTLILLLLVTSITGCASNSSSTESGYTEETIEYEYSQPEVSEPIESYNSEPLESFTTEENLESSPLTFRGETCTNDSSGHEAGYSWAEENNVTNASDCEGNSYDSPIKAGKRV